MSNENEKYLVIIRMATTIVSRIADTFANNDLKGENICPYMTDDYADNCFLIINLSGIRLIKNKKGLTLEFSRENINVFDIIPSETKDYDRYMETQFPNYDGFIRMKQEGRNLLVAEEDHKYIEPYFVDETDEEES